MTKQDFINRIENAFNNANENEDIMKDGFDITSKNEKHILTFAVRVINITDDIIITFGGYGSHFELIQEPDEFDFEEVFEMFNSYTKGYEENINIEELYFCEVECM